jgi:ABC-type lipoprotein export system ATPase subunit
MEYSMRKIIIRLENVVKVSDKGRRVINGMNLCVQENERVAICGPPGSGKNMLMRLIAGMDSPSGGNVFVLDQPVHQMNRDKASVFRNRNIGIIQQESGLMENMSILENVSLPLMLQRVPAAKRKQAAKEQLKSLGIAHIAHALPIQLTEYEWLIASTARALIAQPKILLMYEATAVLSEIEDKQYAGVINAILKYGGYTVLSFSERNMFRMDRIIQIDHGKIQEERL